MHFSIKEQDLFPDGTIQEIMSTDDAVASIRGIVEVESNYRHILYGYTDTAVQMKQYHDALLGVLAVKEKIIDSACEKLAQDLEYLEWLIPSRDIRR